MNSIVISNGTAAALGDEKVSPAMDRKSARTKRRKALWGKCEKDDIVDTLCRDGMFLGASKAEKMKFYRLRRAIRDDKLNLTHPIHAHFFFFTIFVSLLFGSFVCSLSVFRSVFVDTANGIWSLCCARHSLFILVNSVRYTVLVFNLCTFAHILRRSLMHFQGVRARAFTSNCVHRKCCLR